MKKISIFVIALLLLAIFTVLGGFFWYRSAIAPVSNNIAPHRFVINKGASAQQIANKLEKEKLIKSSFAFKLYLQYKGLTTSIPPGEFNIPQNLTTGEVVTLLLKGPSEIWVTIQEGLRREEIALKLAQTFAQNASAVETWEDEFLSLSTGREGFLFPDTYLFPKDATPAKVFEKLSMTFNDRFTQTNTAFSLNEIVTMASLIEREAVTDEERPIVAGIMLNRLEGDWPLQIDASVQYALGKKGNWWPKGLTTDQIQSTSSAYNTYTNTGLPSGPIASPGLSSLKAADSPVRTEYWFYIHDSEGKIHYAKTLDEHNRNIQKYLR